MGWDLVLAGIGDSGILGVDFVDVSQNAWFSAGTGICLCDNHWTHASAAGHKQLLGITLELWWQKDVAICHSPGPAEQLPLLMLLAVYLQAAQCRAGAGSHGRATPRSSTRHGYTK